MQVTAKGPIVTVERRFDYEMERVAGSRFLTTLVPAEDPAPVLELQAELRRQHPHAVHVCFAFVGETELVTRSSDDGEPSKTAGIPMLRVLLGASVRSSAALVTRYFGGTKLGTGGLVRAYTAAVREALVAVPLRAVERSVCKRFACSYAQERRLRHLLTAHGASLLGAEHHAEGVVLRARCASSSWPMLEATLGREISVVDDAQ